MTRAAAVKSVGVSPAQCVGVAARVAAPLPLATRRLVQSLAGRRLGGFPRRLGQPGLQLRDPLPGPLQLRPRLGKLLAQRYHERGEHFGGRRALLSGYTGTLRLKIAERTGMVTLACRHDPAWSGIITGCG